MRPESEYAEALRLIRSGMNDCAVARTMGIPRPTIREWRVYPPDRWRVRRDGGCPMCGTRHLDRSQYAYLLGLYLGDGCLSWHRRGVYHLRITLDVKYPNIIAECAEAMSLVGERAVGRTRAPGCIVVGAWWKHWPCLFPQHGPGLKHKRTIELLPWQRDIARTHPGLLLRGLIHSDGCRILNRVNGTDYPRYHFSNKSGGIRAIFGQACQDYGVRFTLPRRDFLSIARRADVSRLDEVVGPKT
jgi:hypothetical protein